METKPPTPEVPEARAERLPAGDAIPPPVPTPPPPRRSDRLTQMRGWLTRLNWPRLTLGAAALLGLIVILAGAGLLGLNTDGGKRWLVGMINGYHGDDGIGVHVGGIDGSIYGDMTLRDIELRDPKGVFLTSPSLHLDWRPFAYLNKHVEVHDLSSPRIDLLRLPQPNPTPPSTTHGSILPDLAIDIDRLKIDSLVLHSGVAGETRTLSLAAAIHVLHKRAQVSALVLSNKADALSLRLDAVPDDNKLDLDAQLRAPKNGVVASLLGLDRPLDISLGGKGSWKQWSGALAARLGADPLARLSLAATDGTFRVAGATYPGLILKGPSEALLKPQVDIDTTATLRDRSLKLVLALASNAMTVQANGLVDLGYNRFGHLEVDARLLHPETLDKSLSGQDIHADLRLDGAFMTPRVDYDIAASRFGLGGLRLTDLSAKGHSHVEGDGRLIIPLQARLDSFNGIDKDVDPLLTHLRLDGDLVLKGSRLSGDNLHLDSDRVKTTASLSGDLGSNSWLADIKGALNGYHYAGVGTVNLTTEAKLALGKTLTLKGAFAAQSTHWDDDGIAKFLGGNARVAGGYGYGGDVFTLSGLNGTAPALQLQSGDFSIGKGAIAAHLSAHSTAYGPLEAMLSGTPDKPTVVLHAPSPGLGMKIADVVATLSKSGDGFTVVATGGSAYGPFNANTLIQTAKPLTVTVNSAHFAGVDIAGKLTASEAGPFTGALSISGSGLTGIAQLSNANGAQQASLTATGQNVNLPGDLKVHAGRAIITATARLPRDSQHGEASVNADVQMADLTYGGLSLSTGRAKIVLHGDRGTAQAVLHGQASVPFDAAVNADIAPDTLTVAAQGKANGIAFRFDHPARIARTNDTWVLNPVSVVLDQGRVDLAGAFGRDMKLQARLDHLDLGLVNVFSPDAGIGGIANGAIDFTQSGDAFPTAHANVTIDNFTRSSVSTVSTPVNLLVDAALNPNPSPTANYIHALVREGTAVVGRVQMQLSLAPSGEWIKRITNAQVSGGIRYNGPAEVLFSLAGQPHQQLTGAVAVAADVTGQLNAPQLNGLIKASSLTYDNDNLGTRVSAIALDGRFSNDKLELVSFAGRAGDGTVKGAGWLSLAANQHFPMKLHADLSNARLARSDALNSTVSGTLDITNDTTDGPMIRGDLRLPQFRYVVIRQGAAEINDLEGVHKKGVVITQATDDGGSVPSLWKLDIKARAPNQIFVSGMGLESEWSMNLHMTGTTRDPVVTGDMKVIRGTYSFAGRQFGISSGTITFDGGVLTDPQISLTASAAVKDVNGVINVTGSAQRPDIAFSSTPALPQDEVLSRMLFGETVANLSATEALQLASAVNGLRGGRDYLNPLGALRAATGIDRLRVVGADATTGRGTSLAAGKYLTNNVYVEIVTDTKGFTATQIEVALSRALSVLSQTGGINGTAVSVKYSKDY